jgi:type II secretory pathway component GspD/PulD (secretin)
MKRTTLYLALALIGGFAAGAVAEAAPAEAAPAEAPAPAPAAPPPLKDIKQVQIQVWISETTERGLRDLGANLQYRREVRGNESGQSVAEISTNVFDPLDPTFTATIPTPTAPNITWDGLRPDQEPGTAGLQTQTGAGMTFDIINIEGGTIDGVFRAIEQKNDVDLISKPELLVQNATPAEIHAGGEVPYQAINYKDGRPELNVTWRNIGVDMKLTPEALSDDMVKVNLAELGVVDIARIDNIRGIDMPVFSTRRQTGNVLVPNGQTLVIGGLSNRVVRKNEQRVPVIGKVPVLGMAFRGRNNEVFNNHLLIFVSPTIVDLRELKPQAVRALNFWREEKWKNMVEIDEERQMMEEEL